MTRNIDYSSKTDQITLKPVAIRLICDASLKDLRLRITPSVPASDTSIDSPLARALLKKQVDDEVVINTDKGEEIFYIDAIDYESE